MAETGSDGYHRWRLIDHGDEARERRSPPWDGKTYWIWWNHKQPEPGGDLYIAHWNEQTKSGLYGSIWMETYGEYTAAKDVATHWHPFPPEPESPDAEETRREDRWKAGGTTG
jgi:hypothetical protein